MPTRKQMKRERKRRVHSVPRSTAPSVRRPVRDPRTETPRRRSGGRVGRLVSTRARRPVPVPSWGRAARRSGFLFVLMFAVIHFVAPPSGSTTGQHLIQAVLFAVAFAPLTYLMDRIAYRAAQKRGAKTR